MSLLTLPEGNFQTLAINVNVVDRAQSSAAVFRAQHGKALDCAVAVKWPFGG